MTSRAEPEMSMKIHTLIFDITSSDDLTDAKQTDFSDIEKPVCS
jgi:hypothetical protein